MRQREVSFLHSEPHVFRWKLGSNKARMPLMKSQENQTEEYSLVVGVFDCSGFVSTLEKHGGYELCGFPSMAGRN